MKLNMGCGYNKRDGYINVDLYGECEPDLVCDLEVPPWPWESNTIERVLFNHSLEHLGESSRTFLGIMKELYRVCRHGAEIEINVPHYRHNNFANDPTHVRIITPDLLMTFSRTQCDEWTRLKSSDSRLAYYLNVDFSVANVTVTLDEPYASQYQSGQLSDAQLETMIRQFNNVALEYRILMVAIKNSGLER